MADRLKAEGCYVFDEDQGNALGVASVSRRAWRGLSHDNGRTWDIQEIQFPHFVPHLCLYSFEGLLLDDGAYMAPGYGLLKERLPIGWVSSHVMRTRDCGRTWDLPMMAEGRDFDFGEPSITQAANGDVVTILRTTGQREIWTTFSSDGGDTWAKTWDSGLRGSTPWICTSADGLLVAVFGRRGYKYFPQTGVWCGVSRDHGRSWTQHPLLVRGSETVPANGMAMALPDGSIYVVYGFLEGKAVGGTRFHPDCLR